ncbi:MAG: ATP-binding protein, partial [Cystobacter sp.]
RSREQLEGLPLLEALPELRDQGFDVLLHGVMDSGLPHVGTEVLIPVRRPDGTLDRCYFNFTYMPWSSEPDAAPGVLVLAMEVTEAVRARLAVQAERERAERARAAVLDALAAQNLVAVNYLHGPEHVFERANPLYVQLVDREVLGQPFLHALPELEAQGVGALMDETFQTGIPRIIREQPHRVRFRDGTQRERLYDFVLQPVHDAGGRVEGILNLAIDSTEHVRARRAAEQFAAQERARRDVEASLRLQAEDERRQAELLAQRLRESEARQRRVMESSGVGLWELDATTGLIEADARMVELMGLPPGSAFGLESGLRNVPIEDRERVLGAVAAALAGEQAGRYLMVFRTGGEGGVPLRWVEGRAQASFDENGKPLSLAGAMMDVTARKEVEALVARQARQHSLNAQVGLALARGHSLHEMLQACAQALVDELGVAFARIWLHEPAQDVLKLYASEGLHTHLEGPQARVPVGQSVIGLIAQERRPHLSNPVTEEPGEGVLEQAWREGMKAFAGHPLLLGDKLVGVMALFSRQALDQDTLGILRGVADRIALGVERLMVEGELMTRVDFEQKLIGIVSHDLRNPLSAIHMGASLLMRREDLDARATRSLVRIQASAERAARMVKDLLDFTQARLGGGLRVERHPMDMHRMVRGVVEEVEAAWPGRELQVKHEGDGQVTGDEDRLAQVVQNLVTNALKYSPEGSPVGVTLRGEGAEVLLRVVNEGPPIPADKLAIIFEPMQRATAELDKAGRSVGLGLYIVKRIVDAHGGRIEVASTPREGTRFTVWLPRAEDVGAGAPRGKS